MAFLHKTDRQNSFSATTLSGGTIFSGDTDLSLLLATTSQSFDGDRAVKRSGLPLINAGGTTLITWVENYFFPFLPATMSINSFALQESGATFTPTITGTLALNDETIVTARRIENVTSGTTIDNPAGNSYNFTTTDVTSNNTFRNEADVDNNGSPITITSSNSTVSFIRPWFFGMDADANLTGTDLYSNLTKEVVNQSNKTVTIGGTAQFIYFALPDFWTDIVTILDQNGFNVTGSFTKTEPVSVTSVSIVPGLTSDYKVYRSNLTTVPASSDYQVLF